MNYSMRQKQTLSFSMLTNCIIFKPALFTIVNQTYLPVIFIHSVIFST